MMVSYVMTFIMTIQRMMSVVLFAVLMISLSNQLTKISH